MNGKVYYEDDSNAFRSPQSISLSHILIGAALFKGE